MNDEGSELLGDERGPGGVAIRAFRGSRRSSVYRECVVSEGLFRFLLVAGRSRGLPALASLDRRGPFTLSKHQAKRLADEVAVLDAEVDEPRLLAIRQVVLWCARASANSWLTVASPRPSTP